MEEASTNHEPHFNLSTKAGSALLASADYTKVRDITETEGLVHDTGTTG